MWHLKSVVPQKKARRKRFWSSVERKTLTSFWKIKLVVLLGALYPWMGQKPNLVGLECFDFIFLSIITLCASSLPAHQSDSL